MCRPAPTRFRYAERDGLVSSSWEPSSSGPDRRSYRLTLGGTEELHRRAKELAALQETLADFLSRYGEFVASPARAREQARS